MSAKLVIFTGAGISADSGISTFRDADGLWEKHSIDRVANYRTWKSHREEVHAFYNARRAQLPEVGPNEAHRMVARLQARFAGTSIITQNIDDLHERGGATDVLHVHGKLAEMKCEACGHVWDIGYRAWSDDDRCPRIRGTVQCGCKKGVKPNVIMFHEMAPNYLPMWKTFQSLAKQDVLLVIGTSGAVIGVGDVAAASPATAILSNLESSETIPDRLFDHVIHGRASETADKIEALASELLA
jgi:NAD-dependent deacetylase